jgi:hypothetical protein
VVKDGTVMGRTWEEMGDPDWHHGDLDLEEEDQEDNQEDTEDVDD